MSPRSLSKFWVLAGTVAVDPRSTNAPNLHGLTGQEWKSMTTISQVPNDENVAVSP